MNIPDREDLLAELEDANNQDVLYVSCSSWAEDSGIPCVKLEKFNKLKEENRRLELWIDDLQSGMYINCVYCGHRYGPNSGPNTKDFNITMRKALEEHISMCPKHPLSKALKEIDRLKRLNEIYNTEAKGR